MNINPCITPEPLVAISGLAQQLAGIIPNVAGGSTLACPTIFSPLRLLEGEPYHLNTRGRGVDVRMRAGEDRLYPPINRDAESLLAMRMYDGKTLRFRDIQSGVEPFVAASCIGAALAMGIMPVLSPVAMRRIPSAIYRVIREAQRFEGAETAPRARVAIGKGEVRIEYLGYDSMCPNMDRVIAEGAARLFESMYKLDVEGKIEVTASDSAEALEVQAGQWGDAIQLRVKGPLAPRHTTGAVCHVEGLSLFIGPEASPKTDGITHSRIILLAEEILAHNTLSGGMAMYSARFPFPLAPGSQVLSITGGKEEFKRVFNLGRT